MIPSLVDRIRIGSHLIEVWDVPDLRDEDGAPCHGTWDADTDTICRNADDTPDVRHATLVHEATHAISDVYGLGLTESAVRAIEEGLLQSGLCKRS